MQRVPYAPGMSIQADRAHPDGARAWWQRILLVPQAPRAVFAELRDDSREAAEDRQDAIAAVAFFAGVALTLFSSQAASFADDPFRAGIVIPVWLFIAGLLVGLVNYWLAGGALYLALSRLGATSSYEAGASPVGAGGGAARAVAGAPPGAAGALRGRHLPKRRCGLRFRSARLHGARGGVWALVGRAARDRNSRRRGLGDGRKPSARSRSSASSSRSPT